MVISRGEGEGGHARELPMSDVSNISLVVVSGLSGTGKSQVVKFLEDIGYFCIDNLPVPLFSHLLELCGQSEGDIHRVALGVDIRERDFLEDFLSEFDRLKERGYHIELIFLEASDVILQRRFSESRRPHPLAKWGSVSEGIRLERDKLQVLRKKADRVIDTSDYHVHQLKEVITRFYYERGEGSRLNVSLVSFGYRHGIPQDIDLLFDVRFFSNPHFQAALRPLTGEDQRVQDYLLALPEMRIFLEKLQGLLDFLIPLYEKEGKSYLMIGVGCTGGRHRSVAVVSLLEKYILGKGFRVRSRHRDIALLN